MSEVDAANAGRILDDPLFQSAMKSLEDECWRQFSKPQPFDADLMREMWWMVQLSKKFKLCFEKLVQDGVVESHRAAEEQRRRDIETARHDQIKSRLGL